MLIDLLSQNNYCRFNTAIAKIIGLHAAIYLEALLDINYKAIQKNKIRVVVNTASDSENDTQETQQFFVIDRKYVEAKTTIDAAEQFSLDEKLMELDIIKKEQVDSNELCIDIQTLTGLVMNSDEKLTKKIAKLASKCNVNKTKRECISDNLKAQIKIQNPQLAEAYREWIDSIMSNPRAFLSTQALQIAQKDVDSFANHNLDVALEILKIATLNGWKDMTWAINRYRQQHPTAPTVPRF